MCNYVWPLHKMNGNIVSKKILRYIKYEIYIFAFYSITYI